MNEGLRNQISRRTMHEVISGARDELMKELTESLDKFMRRDVGVEVLDVRVKRIDLPPEVSSAVYDRMNSERQILARQFRATAANARSKSAATRTASRRGRGGCVQEGGRDAR